MLYYAIMYGCNKMEPHVIGVAPKMRYLKKLLEKRMLQKFDEFDMYVDENMDDETDEYKNDAANHKPYEIHDVTCATHIASFNVNNISNFNDFLKYTPCPCFMSISIFKTDDNFVDFGKILSELKVV